MLSWWRKFFGSRRRIYLDHAAATPLVSPAKRAMTEVEGLYANPSAVHKEGVAARGRLEAARAELARLLAIRPSGIVFTGSGTESNNLAIYGSVRKAHEAGVSYEDMTIISTKLEHPSVSEVLEHLAELGITINYVNVSEEGLIDEQHFATLLTPQVILVTTAYVNSEIGVVQPVSRLSRTVKQFNHDHDCQIKIHVDAAQAPLWLPCQLDRLGVDLLSLDAGKCGGPKGVGVLAFKYGVELLPVTLGGGQESGLRAATENLTGIVGGVVAITEAQKSCQERSERVSKLRDHLITELTKIEGVVLNGSATERVANNINVSMAGVDGEFAVISLDEAGFAVSTKSACGGAGGGGSAVVRTITGDAARATNTLRITLGESNTKADINKFIRSLIGHINKTRDAHARLTQS